MVLHHEDPWGCRVRVLPLVFRKGGSRILSLLKELDLKMTVFVMIQDAVLDKNAKAIAAFGSSGHEYGNHSFHHEQWFHMNTEETIEEEIAAAEQMIERVAEVRPRGFRCSGFAVSAKVLEVLGRRRVLTLDMGGPITGGRSVAQIRF